MLRLVVLPVHAAAVSSENVRMKSLHSCSPGQAQSCPPNRVLWSAVLALVLGVGAHAQTRTSANSTYRDLQPHTRDQIRLLQEEKQSRSWFQKKLDSQLVYGLRQKRLGVALPGVNALHARLSFEPSGSLLVDIRAEVSSDLLDFIKQNGGTVVSSFPRYHEVRAVVPLEAADSLAKRANVRWIRPAEQAITSATAVEGTSRIEPTRLARPS